MLLTGLSPRACTFACMRVLWCLPPSMVQWAGPDASTPESSAEASANNFDSAIGHAGHRYETGTDDSATMVARINAALSEQGLSLTEFLPADSNELAFLLDILKDLGWSALDRARARKAVRTVHSKATDASVHISIHIWMHMCMCMLTRTSIHMCIHMSVHMATHTCVYTCLHTCLHTLLHMCLYSCLCTCLSSHTSARRHRGRGNSCSDRH